VSAFTAWLCRPVVGFLFWALRHLDPDRLKPAAVERASNFSAIGQHSSIDELVLIKAVMSGPVMATVVRKDGTILAQRGGALSRHAMGTLGASGAALPKNSKVMGIVQHVLKTGNDARFKTSYEAVDYSCIAFPWIDAFGEVIGVAFISIDDSVPMIEEAVKAEQRAMFVNGEHFA
jgi:hypothetical protein